jgi:hypothetical protein
VNQKVRCLTSIQLYGKPPGKAIPSYLSSETTLPPDLFSEFMPTAIATVESSWFLGKVSGKEAEEGLFSAFLTYCPTCHFYRDRQ